MVNTNNMKRITILIAGIMLTGILVSFSYQKKNTNVVTAVKANQAAPNEHFVVEPQSQF